MKSKTIISFLIIILGIIGLFWWGRSVQKSTSANPSSNLSASALALSALETSYDFGKISMAQGLVEKTFEISNPTNQDITVERITTSCMCTLSYISTSEDKEKGPFGMVGHGGTVPKANEIIKAGASTEWLHWKIMAEEHSSLKLKQWLLPKYEKGNNYTIDNCCSCAWYCFTKTKRLGIRALVECQ